MVEISPQAAASTSPQTAALRQAAIDLEARFLSEMLAHTGLSAASDSFGAGTNGGESEFASFQRDAQAQAMAEKGGIGLAEHIFRAMLSKVEGAK